MCFDVSNGNVDNIFAQLKHSQCELRYCKAQYSKKLKFLTAKISDIVNAAEPPAPSLQHVVIGSTSVVTAHQSATS